MARASRQGSPSANWVSEAPPQQPRRPRRRVRSDRDAPSFTVTSIGWQTCGQTSLLTLIDPHRLQVRVDPATLQNSPQPGRATSFGAVGARLALMWDV